MMVGFIAPPVKSFCFASQLCLSSGQQVINGAEFLVALLHELSCIILNSHCLARCWTEEVLTRVVTWKFGPNLFYLPDAMCVTREGKKKMGLS